MGVRRTEDRNDWPAQVSAEEDFAESLMFAIDTIKAGLLAQERRINAIEQALYDAALSGRVRYDAPSVDDLREGIEKKWGHLL